MKENILSKQLVPIVDSNGEYVRQSLPFGYEGSLSLGSEFFKKGVVSVRFHFGITSASTTVSTLLSCGTLNVSVSKGYCVVTSTAASTKLDFLMTDGELYDVVVVGSGSEVHFYLNGYVIGKLEGALGASATVNSSSTPVTPSLVYMAASWSRALSPQEVTMLFTLSRSVGGVDYMEGVRSGMLAEFLPVNIQGTGWFNSVSPSSKGNLSGIDSSKVRTAAFICSEGDWEAAGRVGPNEWVKVRFYNLTFFGSQVCYVGLVGFKGVPEGLGTLRQDLNFNTRPVLGSSFSASAVSTLVVNRAGGQVWSAPEGVTLRLRMDGDAVRDVPAMGTMNEPAGNYVEIDTSKSASWVQSYTNDTGVVRQESFKLEDIQNISYSFTYFDYFGESIVWPTITVGTRGEEVGPRQVVGEVVMTYYVHGVAAKTPPISIYQQANEMWLSDMQTFLEVSSQTIPAGGSIISYRATYGYQQRWTSLAHKEVSEPCDIEIDVPWVSKQAGSVSAPWTGWLRVDAFTEEGQRQAVIRTAVKESGVVNSAVTLTQVGIPMIDVTCYMNFTDDTFRDNVDVPERYLWFTGSLKWGNVSYVFSSDGERPNLVAVKSLQSGNQYYLGTVRVPRGAVWSDIHLSLQCGSVVWDRNTPGATPEQGRGDGAILKMYIRPRGFNLNAPAVNAFLTGARDLASAPYGTYPEAVGSSQVFVSGGNNSPVDMGGARILIDTYGLRLILS